MLLRKIRLSGIISDSIVDGPGLRYVIFTQGCPHNCPGCHNPETIPFKGGKLVSLRHIKKEIKNNPLLTGVTFSGGEPFLHSKKLLTVAKFAHKHNLTVLAYTGYIYEKMLENKTFLKLLQEIDILIDGPFIKKLRNIDLLFRGSSNQRIINVPLSLLKGETIVISDNDDALK